MLRQRARAVGAIAAATMLSLTMGAATGSAAKAPASFYGVSSQNPLTTGDLTQMGEAKVGSLRVVIDWSAIDPTPAAGDNNFFSTDPVVLDAARNGVRVFPFIFGTPSWVAKDLDKQKCKAAKCVTFAP